MLQRTRQPRGKRDQAETQRRGSPSSADSTRGSWGSSVPPSLTRLPDFLLHEHTFRSEAATTVRNVLQGNKLASVFNFQKPWEPVFEVVFWWGVHGRYHTGRGNQTDARDQVAALGEPASVRTHQSIIWNRFRLPYGSPVSFLTPGQARLARMSPWGPVVYRGQTGFFPGQLETLEQNQNKFVWYPLRNPSIALAWIFDFISTATGDDSIEGMGPREGWRCHTKEETWNGVPEGVRVNCTRQVLSDKLRDKSNI